MYLLNFSLKAKIILVCFFSSFSLTVISQNNRPPKSLSNNLVEYDNYGRLIKSATGEKINHPFDQTLQAKANTAEKLSSVASTSNPIHCAPTWKYSIMGNSIGKRSIKSVDIDNNGTTDIVANGYYMGGFWYVMNFNSVKNTYEQTWVSPYYAETITYIDCYDINNDNIWEIFVGFSDGKIRIYAGDTKIILKTIQTSANSNITDIEYADADNDGVKEIVACDVSKFYFFDAVNFNMLNQVAYGTYDCKIGNVDNDAFNEIVTSKGDVLEYHGSTLITQWNFYAGQTSPSFVELSDIDSDSKKEIIHAQPWNTITVYDADLPATKYTITTSQDINSLNLTDINNDNVDEIIYGDGQWGKIHCIDVISHSELWFITNPEHGVTSVSIADVDQNGDMEILWGANWSSSGGDYLYVYDLTNKTQQWRSVAIDGPFYGVKVDDIDNDGTKEIVAVSYESASSYESGIISVFDAVTHNLEWQSNGLFLSNVWTGIFDLKIKDIDKDGVKDIIIAAGQFYTAKIWVIDGVTKAIKSSYLFSNNTKEFSVLDIGDVDDDGNLDIVAVNDKINIIDPVTYAIKWSSSNLGYGSSAKVAIENVDSDPNMEIIYSSISSIYVIDGITHQQWASATNNYYSFDLYDFNLDGIKDIIAGNYAGNLDIIDYNAQTVLSSVNVSQNRIEGIVVANLNANPDPEIVFLSDGRLNFKTSTGNISTTEQFGAIFSGGNNNINVVDVNNDGSSEIIFGSSNSIVELTSSCYQCIWFDKTESKNNVSCLTTNDGGASLFASGGVLPYTYTWNSIPGPSSINNLAAGIYNYTIADGNGCLINDSIRISNSNISALLTKNNIPCNNPGAGSATINVNSGTPPYSFSWSNGSNQSSVSNLSVGSYSATVIDSMYCARIFYFNILKDTLMSYELVSNNICNGGSNGSVSVNVFSGTAPYSFQWGNGSVNSYLNNLTEGIYSYTVTDSHGCFASDTILTHDPLPITIYSTSTPDDPNTPIGDGSGNVSVSGGTAPYSVVWSDPFNQTTPTVTNLNTGTYTVVVTDSYGCSVSTIIFVNIDVSIEEITTLYEIRVYPNPAHSFINVHCSAKEFKVEVSDILGNELFKETYTDQIDNRIDLSYLSNGIYFYTITIDKHVVAKNKIMLSK